MGTCTDQSGAGKFRMPIGSTMGESASPSQAQGSSEDHYERYWSANEPTKPTYMADERFETLVSVPPALDVKHIRFFTNRSLSQLLQDYRFRPLLWRRSGRIKPLAKSIFVMAQRGA